MEELKTMLIKNIMRAIKVICLKNKLEFLESKEILNLKIY